ncbi:MAG: threonine synthase [Bacillota bacterium]
MRLRRVAGTRERLLNYDNLVVFRPVEQQGKWRHCFGNDNPLCLEIGCGRGKFIVNSAREFPEKNFIGLELREEMIMDSIDRLSGDYPLNMKFIWENATLLPEVFAEGEVDIIYLNFSDPWPKNRHAKRRLTHINFLNIYKKILNPQGKIILKTDNRKLFDFSQHQLIEAGLRLYDVDYDYPLKGAEGDVPTEYEMRFRRRGEPIHRLVAKIDENAVNTEGNVMKYISTRGNIEPQTGAAAIRSGMVPGGGLFVPEEIPAFPYSWDELRAMDYRQLAEKVLALYLTDFAEADIKRIVKDSYNEKNFHHPSVAPLVGIKEKMNILELWHGPTAAFKDMALQIMPRLLVHSVALEGGSQEVDILVATSGDTGKAALEGFKNVDGIKIIVFYPHNGVSRAQYLQMATTDGNNTSVVAVKGNFDNCQTGVKEIFGDDDFAAKLSAKGKEFSSANSINWGRLLPQIIYYFWSYAELLKKGKVQAGEKFNVVVPTGNFGNILAGYYAYKMGLPVNRFVCASNSNKVLTDVLATGTYDSRRDFVKTTSPSMDILVSSNFERFFYAMSGGNGKLIAESFDKLKKDGVYTVPAEVKTEWDKVMCGGYAEETDVKATIGRVYKENGYTLDPHTAVAVKVYEDYAAANHDEHPVVVVSTASPFKFGRAVLEAITGEKVEIEAESEVLQKLSEVSGNEIHFALKDVESRPILHNTVVEVSEMPNIVAEILDV